MKLTPERLAALDRIAGTFSKGRFRCGKYACFTDGKCLVGIECEDELPQDMPGGKIPDLIADDPPVIQSAQVDVSEILKWCAIDPCRICKGSRLMECCECDGDREVTCSCKCGERSHMIDCQECDGTGEVTCSCVSKPMAGRIFGVPFDRHLIRKMLEASGVVGTVKISTQQKDSIIDIRFSRGVILVMPMTQIAGMWGAVDELKLQHQELVTAGGTTS